MKILFLVSRFPYPLEKGDKLRAFQHIQNMHASGHKVHLIALSDCKISDESFKKVSAYCERVHVLRLNLFRLFLNLCFAFFRKLPLQVGYFYSLKHRNSICKIISQTKPDVIYCQLIRTALFVKEINAIPKVIDYQDAFSMGTFQRKQKASWFLKPVFIREYNLVKKFELQSFNWFNEHLIISSQDALSIGFPKGKDVTILPNGIDLNYFVPQQAKQKFDITFVGNMNYPPNVDAAIFLIREVMPLVWKELPQATVQLAGANPKNSVKELVGPKVTVTGWVDDIRDCYKNTIVFIAPMRIGIGLQNKLLEAMAMNVACVTTPISFAPLGAEAGKDILVGSNAAGLAKHLISLLKDKNYRNEIATNGNNFVMRNYSMEKSEKILSDVLASATLRK